MVHMKWWRIAAVAGLSLLAGAVAGRAAGEQPPTYVWLFSATGAEAESLTGMVTEEFEESLGKAGCLPIVERRNLPELQSHQRQEQRISADFLSPRERRVLSTASADAVVFGKITDDIQGGQIKVAVSLETLAGVKLADTSVRFSRGKRFDAEERERQMSELASEVCGVLGFTRNDSRSNGEPGSGPGSDHGKSGDGGTDGAEVKRAQGYEFTLQECSASGTDLECWITVRNTRERRKLSVMGRSRLVDEKGASYEADLLESDGSWGGSLFIHVDLATGVPGRFGLRFKGLGEYLKTISLLDVDASGFHVEWRDVQVR
jgi:hypothetical protein